jgi:hypothetical protein
LGFDPSPPFGQIPYFHFFCFWMSSLNHIKIGPNLNFQVLGGKWEGLKMTLQWQGFTVCQDIYSGTNPYFMKEAKYKVASKPGKGNHIFLSNDKLTLLLKDTSELVLCLEEEDTILAPPIVKI